MMRFDLDNPDPLYAPGLRWSKEGLAFWRAPAKYKGFTPAYVNLGRGTPDDEYAPERARLCRLHTANMLAWWKKQEAAKPDFGTWAYLIDRYRTDEFSPYQEVKANTREGYDYLCDRWLKAIGHMKIETLTFVQVKTIEKAMQTKGYSVSNIHRMMTMLRSLAHYGAMLPETRAAHEVSLILSQMRFRTPNPRTVAPTRSDVEAMIRAADEMNLPALAVGMTLQFELCLRVVDVYGQWIRGTGGIERNGEHWVDGLTWDMLTEDCTVLTKIISKTAKSMPEPYAWDLTPLPELTHRLRQMAAQGRIGPVCTSTTSRLPYGSNGLAAAFRRVRDAAGVRDDIKLRDLRAGGLTEAKEIGVPMALRRDAAQHMQEATTDRYSRHRSEAASKVIELRREHRRNKA